MSDLEQDDLAGRLWTLCNVLRDDGIVYHKYLSELTYLLFLKNAKQLGVEDKIPEGCRWDDLLSARGAGMLGAYRKLLTRLGEDVADNTLRNIFSFPTTVFSHDENLGKVVAGIEAIEWHRYDRDALGVTYESLLERNATEARSGSGQYFTPRPLVDSIVKVTQPGPNDVVSDPAAGTGGFLIAAHRSDDGNAAGRFYQGVEIERDTYRLCLMNLYLHGMDGVIVHGDALTEDSVGLRASTLVLANPPFGVSAGGARKRRSDLKHPTSNKQLSFLQFIALMLDTGGRAAVVVPDNVLFEPGVGERIRQHIFEDFDLHTILRLPRGIFYAPDVRTNVLFFNRRGAGADPISKTWFYDLRTGMPVFTKRRTIQPSDFEDFEQAFGPDPFGRADRTPNERFKSLTRQEIRDRNYDLDVRWDDDASTDETPDLAGLVDQISDALIDARSAVEEISAIVSGVDDLATVKVQA